MRLDRPLDAWPELGQALDFGQVAVLAREAAAWLSAAGVGAGDRVAILKENNPDIQVFLYGCLWLGAVPALISAGLGGDCAIALLDRLDPRAIVSDRTTLTRGALRVQPRDAIVVCVDGASPGSLGRADLAGGRPPPPARWRRGEPALVLHTSGTTGIPKLVQHTAESIRRGAFVGSRHRSFRYAPLQQSDTVAACLSWAHVRAVFGFAFALSKGVGLIGLSNPDQDAAAGFLSTTRPSVLEAHPNIFQRWRRLPGHPSQPLRSVRLYVSTADAIHPPTVRALLNASGHARPVFIQVYGMTELGPVSVRVFTRRVASRMRDARNAGMTIPLHSRVRIVDEQTGRRLPPGRAGVMQARTSSRFQTYVGEEGRADAARVGGWFTTADRGLRTWRGGVRLLDRQVDHIPGIPSALVVEEALFARLPSLTEVVLVDLGGGLPTPVVCTAGGEPLDKEEWRLATIGLPPLADPHPIAAEELPMTATWKVRRFMLKERLTGRTAGADPRRQVAKH